LIPTLSYLRTLAAKYQEKYGIEIQIVSENEAAKRISEITHSDDLRPRGLFVFKTDSYHATPILLYPEDPNWTVAVMDCAESKRTMEKVVTDLLKLLPKNAQVLLSYGARIADGNSCRMEAITLLKYALNWAKRAPHVPLSKLLCTRERFFLNSHIQEFKVPKQWAAGAQIKGALSRAPFLNRAVINHKGETYGQWVKRHPYKTVQIQVTIPNSSGEGNFCENTFQKPMNFFLADKVNRFAVPFSNLN
jgi:hypothetical protein